MKLFAILSNISSIDDLKLVITSLLKGCTLDDILDAFGDFSTSDRF